MLSDPPPVPPREAVQRWRLVLARDAFAGDSPRDASGAWEAAIAASGLPAAGLDLPRPRPRYALAAPLAAAVPGEAELLDLYLTERLPAWRLREALQAVVPAPFRLLGAYDVWLGEPALPGRVTASVYRATFEPGTADATELRRAAAALLAAPSLPRTRRKGDASVAYDLRPFLDGIDVAPAGQQVILRMTLRHDPEKGVGRPEEALAALSDGLGAPLEPVSLVRERLELAAIVAPVPRSGSRQPAASPRRPRK